MTRHRPGYHHLPATVLLLAASLLPVAATGTDLPGADLYRQHCASCHGDSRLGGMGPALLPQNLSRLHRADAEKIIASGRTGTQMPAFGDKLDATAITALADYIYQPPAETPVWGETEIRASHRIMQPPGSLPDTPVYEADPLNLFVVVETGDHHVSILDGDRMQPIHRFPSHFALHGGPKFSPDGRYVYFGSRDGWISKYDLYRLKVVAEVRAGINMRNIAVSADGNYLMAANYLPHTLVLFSTASLELMEILPVTGDKGQGSRVSAVYAAPPRNSFIAALKDIPQAWEIHIREGMTSVRRLQTETLLDDFFFDPAYEHLIGAARGGNQAHVINLDKGDTIARLPLPGMPHLGSGITWKYQGRRVMATPHLGTGAVSIIDMENWTLLRTLRTDGPGFFMRSHSNSPYAWVDVFFGPGKDRVHVIDKRTLEIVRTLRPAPGKVAAHVEFDRHGRKLLLSIWDTDGAVVVYDADTLAEEKRIPMNKPSGKYNVWNKIHYEEGTSH